MTEGALATEKRAIPLADDWMIPSHTQILRYSAKSAQTGSQFTQGARSILVEATHLAINNLQESQRGGF